MFKTNSSDLTSAVWSAHLSAVAKKCGLFIERLRSISLLSEDMAYKRRFINEYAPLLYRKHTAEMQSNCVFCAYLVKSGCHRQCFKCSRSKYTECRPLLPGLLNCETIYPYGDEKLKVPWYYTETCSSFSRLPQENYLRNFRDAYSSAVIYNFETLESLEKGLLSGEKPCHVCASTDYGIYKRCYGQGDFNAFSPCRRIIGELADFYRNQESQA